MGEAALFRRGRRLAGGHLQEGQDLPARGQQAVTVLKEGPPVEATRQSREEEDIVPIQRPNNG